MFWLGSMIGFMLGGALGVFLMAVMCAANNEQYQIHRKGELR